MTKRRNRRGRAIGWLVVAIQLLISVEAPVGLNLCIAEDGHTAIEFSHAQQPSCNRDSERHHPGEQVSDAHDVARHPCNDVPLLRATAYVTTAQPRHLLPALLALPESIQIPQTRGLEAPSLGPVEQFIAPNATHLLRTVVLLV